MDTKPLRVLIQVWRDTAKVLRMQAEDRRIMYGHKEGAEVKERLADHYDRCAMDLETTADAHYGKDIDKIVIDEPLLCNPQEPPLMTPEDLIKRARELSEDSRDILLPEQQEVVIGRIGALSRVVDSLADALEAALKENAELRTPPRGYPECTSAIVQAMSQKDGAILIRKMHADEKLIEKLGQQIIDLTKSLTPHKENEISPRLRAACDVE